MMFPGPHLRHPASPVLALAAFAAGTVLGFAPALMLGAVVLGMCGVGALRLGA